MAADKLFVYGSLQPGGPNEHVLDAIGGTFEPASVRGRLLEAGWGASLGYPGLVLDQDGPRIEGYLFTAATLDQHWPALDDFEGEAYERVSTPVTLADGTTTEASLYVLREPA